MMAAQKQSSVGPTNSSGLATQMFPFSTKIVDMKSKGLYDRGSSLQALQKAVEAKRFQQPKALNNKPVSRRLGEISQNFSTQLESFIDCLKTFEDGPTDSNESESERLVSLSLPIRSSLKEEVEKDEEECDYEYEYDEDEESIFRSVDKGLENLTDQFEPHQSNPTSLMNREEDDDSYDETDSDSSEEGWEGELPDSPKKEGTSSSSSSLPSTPDTIKRQPLILPPATSTTTTPTTTEQVVPCLLTNSPSFGEDQNSVSSPKTGHNVSPHSQPKTPIQSLIPRTAPGSGPAPVAPVVAQAFHKATPSARMSPRKPFSSNSHLSTHSTSLNTEQDQKQCPTSPIASTSSSKTSCYLSSITTPVTLTFFANQRSNLSTSTSGSVPNAPRSPSSIRTSTSNSPTIQNDPNKSPTSPTTPSSPKVVVSSKGLDTGSANLLSDSGAAETVVRRTISQNVPPPKPKISGPPPATLEPKKPQRKPKPSAPGASGEATARQKQVKMRARVFEELVKTEQVYVEDMCLTSKLFYLPLKTCGYLEDKQISILFSNLTTLLGVSHELLKDLEKEEAINNVGSTFCFMIEFLKLYAVYCTNHPEAVLMLDSCRKNFNKLDSFLKEQQENPLCRGLPLNGFLIKPVQRVTKYPLLLKELKKYTESTHSDYKNLEQAIFRCETILSDINSYQIAMENHHRLLRIKDCLPNADNIIDVNRDNFLLEDFVREATLPPSTSSNQESESSGNLETKRMFYILLNTLIIRATPKKRNLNVYSTTLPARNLTNKHIYDKLRISQVIPLANLIDLKNVEDNESNNTKNAFQLIFKKPKDQTEVRLLIMSSSAIQKTEWIMKLNSLTNPANKTPTHRITSHSDVTKSFVKSIW
eukprot:TRINITY_DN12919_c0_g1_i1.p1 TRINITY_DN12919_c0_g1~~TRINITY_DN12919_c0_g1_i1.p1  ORF type:complete len:871 (+),score=169.84 TRINITY_DN12919_c0_g1_i1:170-2782(+)